jgi:hypothetical protein
MGIEWITYSLWNRRKPSQQRPSRTPTTLNRHPTPSGRSVEYTNALSDNSEASVKSNSPVQAFPRAAYGFDWHRTRAKRFGEKGEPLT